MEKNVLRFVSHPCFLFPFQDKFSVGEIEIQCTVTFDLCWNKRKTHKLELFSDAELVGQVSELPFR